MIDSFYGCTICNYALCKPIISIYYSMLMIVGKIFHLNIKFSLLFVSLVFARIFSFQPSDVHIPISAVIQALCALSFAISSHLLHVRHVKIPSFVPLALSIVVFSAKLWYYYRSRKSWIACSLFYHVIEMILFALFAVSGLRAKIVAGWLIFSLMMKGESCSQVYFSKMRKQGDQNV